MVPARLKRVKQLGYPRIRFSPTTTATASVATNTKVRASTSVHDRPRAPTLSSPGFSHQMPSLWWPRPHCGQTLGFKSG